MEIVFLVLIGACYLFLGGLTARIVDDYVNPYNVVMLVWVGIFWPLVLPVMLGMYVIPSMYRGLFGRKDV